MLDKFKNHFGQNLPFVLYAKPSSDEVNGVFQKNDVLHSVDDYTEKGFVFAPFDNTLKPIYIPFEDSEILIESWSKKESASPVLTDISYLNQDKIAFETLVNKTIKKITSSDISKIVASRKEEFYPDQIDVFALFETMLSKYPTAFKYCLYHPKVGLWLGATPEKLLSIKGNNLQTMAYAGTQKFEGVIDVSWGDKEKEEQKFVTDFILRNLQDESQTILCSEPYTSQAGTLLHIRTDIKAELNSDFSLEHIIEKLHPTPAVCGLPKDLAKDFILKNEGYNRKYYAGYLGELNSNLSNVTELYVNLRCMEIEDEKVNFYVGCGITKDSIAENEFFETVNKSVTMKSLFKK